MIYVDTVQTAATPWRGGRYSHLISDQSVEELLAFAKRIGLSLSWFQHRASIPHFDVAPSFRARALAAGAQPVDKREFVAAMRRFRERNEGPWTSLK